MFPATIQKQNKILEYKSGGIPSDPVPRNGATTVPRVDNQGYLISIVFLFVTYKIVLYPLFKPAAKVFPEMYKVAKVRRSCRDRQIGTSEGLDMLDCL
ncbi:uncharacterized protein Bfra_006552 [Botrytis fragariae]|uniref:Uncharacterized protein n=1 Tax=Botrytis fragariae TaxID=1964551 RepID=A0A8H6EP75_9HELO|nr:uncharacterized protein Bfra_006552 [Botrytis fragariae]KAF5879344.1 hypothetical protein Bfra_006552 [Botrytis fragariae]